MEQGVLEKISNRNNPEKSLLVILKKKAGRSNTGRITVRHKGGGAKQKYRIIEFGQSSLPFPLKMKINSIEYDPNRTCLIALAVSENGKKMYVLAPNGLKVGNETVWDEKTPVSVGNRMKVKNIPIGTDVYNIEIEPGNGGKIARSAGNFCQIMGQEGKYVHLKMPSSEIRKVFGECFASIGQLSRSHHRFEEIGKAGKSRWKGVRPSVRGSAMNACDHPHGGGKNKVGIGMKAPKTPWGKKALGVKTRRRKKWTNKMILQRRKKKN